MAKNQKNLKNVQTQSPDRFWNFIPATPTKPPELLLYGSISSQQSWWEDRVTPNTFNAELAELGEDVPEIVVRINSGGGDVFAANAIYTRLKDHSAKIIVKIDGWAASAATIIAMAGDKIKIARNGVFMIHDPAMTVWDTFKAEEFEKMAQELKVIKQSIVNTYSMKTNREPQDIEALMSDETWWTGDKAVENGFCDEIMFEDTSTIVENANKIIVNSVPIDISPFQTIPKALLNTPGKPGGFSNKENPENKKKEERTMEENKITTTDTLAGAYPDLVHELIESAKAEERARIKAVQEMSLEGFEDVVNDAMFENPVSPEAVALKIIQAQKKLGGNYIAARNKDAKESGADGIGDSSREKGNEEKNPFEDAIEKLFLNKK